MCARLILSQNQLKDLCVLLSHRFDNSSVLYLNRNDELKFNYCFEFAGAIHADLKSLSSSLNCSFEKSELILDNQRLTLKGHVFVGLFRSISLQNNLIGSCEPGTFRYTPLLERISFTGNVIRTLNSFESCFSQTLTYLEYLSFKSNKIASLNSKTFTKFPYLRYLDLSRNSLIFIKKNWFNSLTHLVQLNLSFNQIIDIESDSFRRLISLKKIDFSSNSLTEFDKEMFGENSNLTEIRLSQNKISSIKDLNLLLDQVEQLYLDHNNLKSLESCSFNMKNLTHLDLAFNRIVSLNGSIQCLDRLMYLNLASNLIEYVMNVDFPNDSSILFLDLSSNPINSVERYL